MVKETPIEFEDGNIRTEFEDFQIRQKNNERWLSDPTFSILHELYIFTMGAIGTIIWGYGDLIYKWF